MDNSEEVVSLISNIMDVYERLIKAREWNQYQDKKHTECAEQLIAAREHIRSLEDEVIQLRDKVYRG